VIYWTYFGGSTGDDALGIAADSAGDVFFAGNTRSSDFPLSNPTLQGTIAGSQNAFVAGLDPAGTKVIYSTYLGGSGPDTALAVTVDSNDVVYVTGQTNSSNFPFTTNATQATLSGTSDAFVSVIDPSTNTNVFTTFLGGSGDEDQFFASIALDSSKNVYVTGDTDSSSPTAFPTTAGAIQPSWSSGGICTNSNNVTVPCPDAFVTAFTTP